MYGRSHSGFTGLCNYSRSVFNFNYKTLHAKRSKCHCMQKWKWLYQIRQYTAHLVDQSRMSVMYILLQSSKKFKGKKANFYQKRTEEAMIIFSKTMQIASEKNPKHLCSKKWCWIKTFNMLYKCKCSVWGLTLHHNETYVYTRKNDDCAALCHQDSPVQ